MHTTQDGATLPRLKAHFLGGRGRTGHVLVTVFSLLSLSSSYLIASLRVRFPEFKAITFGNIDIS